MPILNYLEHRPSIGPDVDVADDATVVGKVRVTGPALINSRAVLRGDQNWIDVAPRFRIGAGSTVHVEFHTPTHIGSDVWVGQGAVIHACTLGDGVRVEDGGLVLSGSVVGAGSVVAADALVTEGAKFPAHSYIAGTPGKRIRDTTPEERQETVRRCSLPSRT
jgi:carbonic anhydrase/acetyltransferase-like protein (isoleucine patch superfamily)